MRPFHFLVNNFLFKGSGANFFIAVGILELLPGHSMGFTFVGAFFDELQRKGTLPLFYSRSLSQ